MQVGPKLYVEGRDDENVVCQLLIRHGINATMGSTPRGDVHILVREAGGADKLLAAVPSILNLAEDSVGFVLDADGKTGRDGRWAAVSGRLREVGIEASSTISRTGFLAEHPRTGVRTGVWLMPDNDRDGTIEDLLLDLVASGDPLRELATEATDEAMRLDRRFPVPHRLKAIVHTWLAWQEQPGCAYGSAIHRRYFVHDVETALRFVNWVRSLLGQ